MANDFHDAQAVIAENLAASFFLRAAVAFVLTPARHRLGIAPEGKRENLSLIRQALKALNRDEPVDPLEIGAKRGGDVEIVLAPARLGLDFEDHGIHLSLQRATVSANESKCR